MTIKEMIDRLRLSAHDEDEIGYTDAALLNYINDGVRIVKRTIAGIRPMLLSVRFTGIVPVTDTDGEAAAEVIVPGVIKFDRKISQFIDVKVGDKRLQQINWVDKDMMNVCCPAASDGEPRFYIACGYDAIEVLPHPGAGVVYNIIAVPDMSYLGLEDEAPFPEDITDFVYEYALARASLTNEFDMSQETSIIGMLTGQVEAYLYRQSPTDVQTSGYWDDSSSGVGNGWGRYK